VFFFYAFNVDSLKESEGRMIDEKKRKCIELLVSGEHNKTDIAKIVGIDRTTIYNWLADNEFVTELNSRLQQIKDVAQKEFDSKLLIAIDEYWKLAMTTNDTRTKETALYKWIERGIGKVSNSITVSTEVKPIPEKDILEDFENEDQSDIIEIE